jgi:hypothetical protein
MRAKSPILTILRMSAGTLPREKAGKKPGNVTRHARGVPLTGQRLPFVGEGSPLTGQPLPFAGRGVLPAGRPLPFVGRGVPPTGQPPPIA